MRRRARSIIDVDTQFVLYDDYQEYAKACAVKFRTFKVRGDLHAYKLHRIKEPRDCHEVEWVPEGQR